MSEILDVVDENDNIIGQNTRHDSYRNKTPNRIVDVIIKNSKGEILVQKRSKSCSFLPGYMATSCGGHVSSGETYIRAAKKELYEEIGLNCKIKEIGKYKADRKELDIKYMRPEDRRDESHTYFCTVYEGVWDGEFTFNDGEVDEVEFFSIEQLKVMVEEQNINMMAGLQHALTLYLFR